MKRCTRYPTKGSTKKRGEKNKQNPTENSVCFRFKKLCRLLFHLIKHNIRLLEKKIQSEADFFFICRGLSVHRDHEDVHHGNLCSLGKVTDWVNMRMSHG